MFPDAQPSAVLVVDTPPGPTRFLYPPEMRDGRRAMIGEPDTRWRPRYAPSEELNQPGGTLATVVFRFLKAANAGIGIFFEFPARNLQVSKRLTRSKRCRRF